MNGIFRPFPYETNGKMGWISFCENGLFLLLFGWMLLTGKKKKEYKIWFWSSLVFFMMICVLAGMTTPVSGALVRYRLPGQLWLLIGLLLYAGRTLRMKRRKE
jgi:hypothetical protein